MNNANNIYIDNLRKKFNKDNNSKFFIRTYGCQMNEHDSEIIEFIFKDMNLEKTEKVDEADVVLINTCAIRNTAENKAYGFIGSLKSIKEKNPESIIIVSGCLPVLEESRQFLSEKFKHIDILIGTSNYVKIPEYMSDFLERKKQIIDTSDFYDLDSYDTNYIRAYEHKAFVNITYGCNNFCSYCVVPYTRGREQSREFDSIIKEINSLVENGVKEVTLLGQNVNSYGKTLQPRKSFFELLEELDKISGLERIRFMTSHPKDISYELLGAYGKLNKLCNHLHLPVQSGSNKVLKEMNRRYSREEYLEKIKYLKEKNPDVSLSTDIIVGFPGETEEDFQETLDLVRRVRYDFAYTFLYSPREGTPANEREDQIDHDIKIDRFNRLNELINTISLEKNSTLLGETVEVLVDDISKNDKEFLSGRTENFKLVNFKGNESLIGNIVKIKVTNINTFALEGELIEAD